MPAWNEYKEAARERGSLAWELYVVRTYPNGNMDLVKETLQDHLAYQKELEAYGTLVMAGPVSDETGDQMEAEGMIIYRAKDLDEARALANGDPMHKVGARRYEVRKWLVNEGALNVSLSLSGQKVQIS